MNELRSYLEPYGHKKRHEETERKQDMNRTGFVGESIFWETIPMKKLNYTPEIRERAVQLVIESEKDYPSNWAAVSAIAPKLTCWAVQNDRYINQVGHFYTAANIKPYDLRYSML